MCAAKKALTRRARILYQQPMDSPSLRQLDIFAQMVAAGDAARCAADLGVTVDQLLGDIAALELRLGYRLFEHPVAAARLTPAGRKTAQAMLQLAQDDQALHAGAPETGPLTAPDRQPAAPPRQPALTIAMPAPVFGHLQDGLAAFEGGNGDLDLALDLSVHDAREAAAVLASARADIAYFYALDEADAPSSRYGWSEPLNLYVGAAHPLAALDSVSRAALSVTPALTFAPDSGLRRVIDAALSRGRAAMAQPLLESDDMGALLDALRDGAGCFAAFGPLARDLGRMSGVRRLPLDMPLPAIEVRQAIANESRDKPGVEALAEFLFL